MEDVNNNTKNCYGNLLKKRKIQLLESSNMWPPRDHRKKQLQFQQNLKLPSGCTETVELKSF